MIMMVSILKGPKWSIQRKRNSRNSSKVMVFMMIILARKQIK